MKVMIAAGGTGGHIYPGIAVAQEIMRRDAGSKVQFVGTARGLETRLVPQAGFELSLIESAGLKNVSLGARVKGIAVLPKSFTRSPIATTVLSAHSQIPLPPGCCNRKEFHTRVTPIRLALIAISS